tara:strand:+ start:659 stop:964 length:306 start_codon:yes stop_codon:yes gene_type:complete
MGLLDLYTNFNNNQGSSLNYNGVEETTSPALVGSTAFSKLHADGTIPGFSLNGNFAGEVNNSSNQYNNGGAFPLGTPSTLDLDGADPAPYPNPETGETYNP